MWLVPRLWGHRNSATQENIVYTGHSRHCSQEQVCVPHLRRVQSRNGEGCDVAKKAKAGHIKEVIQLNAL